MDRVACPWLIRRFLDSDAEFYFVPREQVIPEAARLGAIPFDAEGVEFGHHGNDCSFETIIKRRGLTDPALLELAKIVHGTDMKDPRAVPEAAGLLAIAEGMTASIADDHEKLVKGFPIYDALYAWCKAKVAVRSHA